MSRAETITRALQSRLGQEGFDTWAERIKNASDRVHRLRELEALRTSRPGLSTKATALLNQTIELLEAGDVHREQLLDATLWCMNDATLDAFRFRVERFLEHDHVVLGTIEPPNDKDGQRFVILRGDSEFARAIVASPSARAELWYTDQYPPTFGADGLGAVTARPSNATVQVSVSEPELLAYRERQTERERNDLVRAQGFKLIGAEEQLVYWDDGMNTVWHRMRSRLNPETNVRETLQSFTLPRRFDEFDMVLGSRSEGGYEKRESLTMLRQLSWAAWYEDPATGDRWYEDVPHDAARAGGPPRFRRAGVRRAKVACDESMQVDETIASLQRGGGDEGRS